MSNQYTCPIGSFQGPQQLTGPITQTLLRNIENRDKPFFIDIEPKGIRPTVVKDQYIQESYNNSVEIDSLKYNLFSLIRIYNPVHTGYVVPQQPANQSPIAELILPAISQSTPLKIALICFPIFVSNNSSAYSAYLDQLWNSEAQIANLQTLFMTSSNDTTQVSISYTCCKDGKNVNIYVFPIGISMPSANWQRLVNVVGSPVNFLSANSTLSLLNLSLSQSSLLTVTSDDFTNRFVYYSKPPGLRGKFNGAVCPAYKTSEYKCVPFDRIRDLQGDKVVLDGATTLADRLTSQDVAKDQAINSVGGPSSSTEVGVTVAAIAGASIGALLLIWATSAISKRLD